MGASQKTSHSINYWHTGRLAEEEKEKICGLWQLTTSNESWNISEIRLFEQIGGLKNLVQKQERKDAFSSSERSSWCQ